MTPGTQPQHVSKKTIKTEPHPLSITAKSGKNNDNKARRQDIYLFFLTVLISHTLERFFRYTH